MNQLNLKATLVLTEPEITVTQHYGQDKGFNDIFVSPTYGEAFMEIRPDIDAEYTIGDTINPIFNDETKQLSLKMNIWIHSAETIDPPFDVQWMLGKLELDEESGAQRIEIVEVKSNSTIPTKEDEYNIFDNNNIKPIEAYFKAFFNAQSAQFTFEHSMSNAPYITMEELLAADGPLPH